jgi:hypothetical protein
VEIHLFEGAIAIDRGMENIESSGVPASANRRSLQRVPRFVHDTPDFSRKRGPLAPVDQPKEVGIAGLTIAGHWSKMPAGIQPLDHG